MNSKNRLKMLQNLEKHAKSLELLRTISDDNDVNLDIDGDSYAENFFQKVLSILIDDMD